MNPPMQYSLQGDALTESMEGFSSTAYFDEIGGVWTIAFGHTRGVYKGMTCDRAQGIVWLHEDMALAEQDVNENIHRNDITQGEFDAMCDFTFNLGCAAFNGSTLAKDVNAGNFVAAATEFEKWDHAKGKVIAGLLKRRIAEENLFKGAPNADS